jgi:hypothetical protein
MRAILERALSHARAQTVWEDAVQQKYRNAPSMRKAIERIYDTIASCALTAAGTSGVPDMTRVPTTMLQFNLQNIDALLQSACVELGSSDPAAVRAEVIREARIVASLEIQYDQASAALKDCPELPLHPVDYKGGRSVRTELLDIYFGCLREADEEYLVRFRANFPLTTPATPAAAAAAAAAAAPAQADTFPIEQFIGDSVALLQQTVDGGGLGASSAAAAGGFRSAASDSEVVPRPPAAPVSGACAGSVAGHKRSRSPAAEVAAAAQSRRPPPAAETAPHAVARLRAELRASRARSAQLAEELAAAEAANNAVIDLTAE